MNPFFWRIFLSTWGAFALALLTAIVAVRLPLQFNDSGEEQLSGRMVGLVARDIRRELSLNPDATVRELIKPFDLDMGPVYTIYVVDQSGHDLLNRVLPEAVTELLATPGDPIEAARGISHRLSVEYEGLAGHMVIGMVGFFPLGKGVMKRGVRETFLVLALVISAFLAMWLARFIVKPIHQLRLAGRKVAEGDLQVRVSPAVEGRSDDIAKLTRDFDVMTEKVAGLLGSRDRLLRDVSHELRSPLARLQALLSLQRLNADASDSKHLDRMESELERLDTLIGEILNYSRLEAVESVDRHLTDLADLLQTIVDDAALEAEQEGKATELAVKQDVIGMFDSHLIHRAVENVVRNAIEKTPRGTSVSISMDASDEQVVIRVADRGPGVPEDLLGGIFEPFYRIADGRETRSGSGGIGLAIASRAVRLHGGKISATNIKSGGLSVVFTLPLLHP